MKEALEAFGLTSREAEVYLALLTLGSGIVQEIARKAGTYRTYTYEVLQALKEKGLVSSVIKSGTQYFEAAPPERLANMLKEKENKMKMIIPQLQALYHSSVEKPKVEFYEGKEGLKTILDHIIKTKKEILVYGSTKKQIRLLQFYFPQFIRKRVEEKIDTRVLTERSKDSLLIHKNDKSERREMRFLPNKLDFPTVTNIYGNNVAILSLEKEIVGVIIENEAIAQTQRMVFELLWQMAVH